MAKRTPAADEGFTPDEGFSPDAGFTPDDGFTPDPVEVEPGRSADKPLKSDLYGDTGRRIKSGFADLKGARSMMDPELDIRDIRKNAAGETVIQDSEGNWYRDDSDFLDNPGNWMASAIGAAPKNAGMIAGGLLGVGAGALAANPLASAGLGVAGAQIGSGLGEGAAQDIGGFLGVRGEYDPGAIQEAMAEGGMGEVGGKAVDLGVHVAKPFVAPVTSKLTGVAKPAIERLLERAKQVLSPKSAIQVAEQGGKEILDQSLLESRLSRGAKNQFKETFGGQKVPTTDILSYEGKMPSSLGEFERKYLTTPEVSSSIVPDALESKLQFNRDKTVLKEAVPDIRMTPIREEVKISKPQDQWWANPRSPYTGTQVPVSSVERSIAPAGKPVTLTPKQEEIAMNELLGVENQLPYTSADRMLRGTDELDADIAAGFDKLLPGQRQSPELRAMKSRRHQMKEPLHEMSPEYGRADARFSRFAKDTRLLQRSVPEGGRESFVSGLAKNNNKTDQMRALERVAPSAYNDVLDMQAANAFDNSSEKMLGNITKRQLLTLGLGGAGAGAGSYLGLSPGETAALAGTLMAGSSPWMAKKMIGTVLPNSAPFARGAAKLVGAKASPWRLLDEEKKNEK